MFTSVIGPASAVRRPALVALAVLTLIVALLGGSSPAHAQAKTIAARANNGRGLRGEVGTEERTTGRKSDVRSPGPVLKCRTLVRKRALSTPLCARGISHRR